MVRNPMENHKEIGFLSNTGPDPWENHKATKAAFNSSMLGRHRPTREMPFKSHFSGCFKWYLEPLSLHQLKKLCQSCTHSDKTFWIRACDSEVIIICLI